MALLLPKPSYGVAFLLVLMVWYRRQ